MTKLALFATTILATTTTAAAAGGGCPETISVQKKWTKDTADISAGIDDWTWKVGIGTKARMFGDCDRIGVETSLTVRSRGFSFPVTFPALDATLSATTNKAKRQSVTLTLSAFTYTLETYELADSSDPLKDIVQHNFVLPVDGDTSGSLTKTIGIPTTDYSLELSASYELVATLYGILNYDVKPKYLDARLWAYADIGGSVHAGASLTKNLDDDSRMETITLAADATLQLFRGYADARGTFEETYLQPPTVPALGAQAALAQPSINNAWRVTGTTGYYIYEGLEGEVVATIKSDTEVFEDLIDEEYELVALPGLPASFPMANGWSHEKSYFKPY
jgi:hypothetical protein